jgi:uncharacterized membrane protein YfcA
MGALAGRRMASCIHYRSVLTKAARCEHPANGCRVGASAIGMTALVLLYPRTPIARLVGSDIAHAVPLTLIAGVGHWLLGSVDWVLLGSLVVGSLPGIFFGSHLSARVPDKVLRPVLATILVIVGVRMLRA